MRRLRRTRWHQLAYLARYAHQPLPVLLDLTISDLAALMEAISAIVEEENGPRERAGG